jgi:sugar lactone lactonase YvrE
MDAQADQVIGEGRHRYRFRRDWARLPRWWNFGSDAAGRPPQTAVHGGVAANGDVYVLARAAHPVTVFDGDGNFITAWGESEFTPFVHGLRFAPDGTVWITDSGDHTVKQFTPDGRKLRTLGTAGAAAPTLYGNPFNMPTGVAFHPNGDIYVSDGYGNRRVHRFAPDGERRESWGGPGTGPGEFAIVHFVEIDGQGRVYIADRENHRIQLFDADGKHLADWTGFDMPSDLAFGDGVIVVGGRDGLSIWDMDRAPLARFAADEPRGRFNIHGVWMDGAGNIFLAHFDRAVSKLTRI